MRRRYRLRGALCGAVLFALTSSSAEGGTYRVSPCWSGTSMAARGAPSTATPGMETFGRCEPGMRSVQTGNSVTTGSVGRKANAEAVFDAPAGTRFASVRWSGKVRRVELRAMAATLLLEPVPSMSPVALDER